MSSINGKIARIDLKTGDVSAISIDKDEYRRFLGGAGLAARILYPMLSDAIDPLSPGNPLLFMAGALAGVNAPNCGRHVVCARSPLTGIWGESNSGGFWSAELKNAGWDGLLFINASEKPVYVVVSDDTIHVKDATDVWGKNVFETEEVIKKLVGNPKARISSIGIAGEHMVKYAAIMNDEGRAAGRTGMGAVMGSKKLKAIAVIATGKTKVHDQEKFDAIRKQLVQEIQDNFTLNMFKDLGTAGYLDMASITGDLSFKYFTQGSWEGAYDISGSTMSEKILKKQKFCKQCSVGCGRIVEVADGKYKTPGLVDGPEYETCGSFGGGLLVNDIQAIAKANHMCNDYGLDTISCGIAIAFAYHLQEKGIITKDKADGLELQWGNMDPALVLIEKIAKREGLGDVLADGTVGMANRLGVSRDEAAAVNGLEIPFHEPRAYMGSALEYATSHRGACHQTAQYYLTSMGAPFPSIGIECIDRFEEKGVADCVIKLQNLRAVYQSLSMCNFIVPSESVEELATLFSAATGIPMGLEQLMEAGERINTLRRLVNLKLGYKTENERLPAILLQPLDGGTEGHVPDVERQLSEYYALRKWDRKTGMPPEQRIQELEIADLKLLF